MKTYERQNASMMLVGDVANKICILVDDMIDTGNTVRHSISRSFFRLIVA